MKEIITSAMIIVCILIGNKITQNYTKASIEDTSIQLSSLKEDMKNNNENNLTTINKIHENWDKKYEKLAYYIEHNELEKVESGLTLIRSYIETEEYGEGIGKVDETIYLLRHIEDKNKFNIKNIF